MKRIPIKLYYKENGTLYNLGNKNKAPFLTKLSNLIFRIYLYIPYESSEYSVQANFKKPDKTTISYAMTPSGKYDEINEIKFYEYYTDIKDSVLNISSQNRSNILDVSFRISDGNADDPLILNTSTYSLQCTYSITGDQPTIEETELQYLQRTYDTALLTKPNKDETILTIDELPLIVEDENDTDYNIGQKYLVSNKLGLKEENKLFKQGEIIEATKDGFVVISKVNKSLIKINSNKVYNSLFDIPKDSEIGSIFITDSISDKFDLVELTKIEGENRTFNLYDEITSNSLYYIPNSKSGEIDVLYRWDDIKNELRPFEVNTQILITDTSTIYASLDNLKSKFPIAEIGTILPSYNFNGGVVKLYKYTTTWEEVLIVNEQQLYLDLKTNSIVRYYNSKFNIIVDGTLENRIIQQIRDNILELDNKINDTKQELQEYTNVQVENANTYTDNQLELERTSNTEKFNKKLDKNFLLYSKKTSVDGNEIIPVLYNGANNYVILQNIIDKVQTNVIDKTNAIVTFAYDNYQSFLERVKTTTENGITTLVSITNEDDSLTLTANQINIGFTVLLREKDVPDYWLSKKSVESEYAINLFTEFETKLNLEDYVLKTELVNYAKKEETIYNNATPTTSALGGIPKGTTFDNKPIKEILDDLLYPYVAFSASMSTSPNGGTFEKGTTQNVSTATVSITLGSKQITSIKVLDSSNNVLAEKTSGITTSNSFTLNKSVTNNTNFKAIVTDGTTSKTVTSGTFTFVNPYYYGAINDGATLTETLIKGLTKSISSKGTKTFTITMNQQKAVVAYPSSYGNLTKILDENSFNVTDTFVKNTLTIDNVNYYVYVLNTPATSTMKYTFSY